MKRFFFHLKKGDELILDDDGTELPDIAAAMLEALLAARELLADAIQAGEQKVAEALVIADEAGRTLEVLPLIEVLPESLKRK